MRPVAIALVLIVAAAPAHAQQKQPNWKNVEADNGSIFKVDMNSIYHFPNGTAELVAYAVEGDRFMPQNMRRLWFDCQGRYRDQTEGARGPTLPAPPRSVVGQFAQLACVDSRKVQ